MGVLEGSHALCDCHLHCGQRLDLVRRNTAPWDRPTPTLRAAAPTLRTLQGVPPSWCGPCSGVEWVTEPHQGLGSRHGQAACEPGGGECGGVPVYPARLHSHRTSPAHALFKMIEPFAIV
jgi:hypothetical protein